MTNSVVKGMSDERLGCWEIVPFWLGYFGWVVFACENKVGGRLSFRGGAPCHRSLAEINKYFGWMNFDLDGAL
jgi:hypothetical protein